MRVTANGRRPRGPVDDAEFQALLKAASAPLDVRERSPVERRAAVRASLVASGITPIYDMVRGSAAGLIFQSARIETGFSDVLRLSWPSESTMPDDLKGVVFRENDEVVIRFPDGRLAHLAFGFGSVEITVAAASREAAVEIAQVFQARFPATYALQNDDGVILVPVTFWAMGPFGPTQRMRRIEATSWEDIEQNYTAAVGEQLGKLMTDFTPGGGGQLILWQGPPGTGKTWALRALAHEWRDWAEFHYITDPDAFFVDEALYMVDVLLSDSYQAIDMPSGEIVEETDQNGKWRVLILEDTGELLSANAKERYGQGLSRLLNVVDGMIGQGLRVLVVVTTNDELGELNPAMRRPGRCAAQIVFAPLSAAEAARWLDDEEADDATLAELYSKAQPPAQDDEPEEALVAAATPVPFDFLQAQMESSQLLARAALGALEAFAQRPPQPMPDIHVHTPRHDLNVNVTPPATEIHMPEQAPPNVEVNVEPAQVQVTVPEQPAPVVHVAAAEPTIVVNVEPPKPRSVRVQEDPVTGEKVYVTEEVEAA